MCEGLQQHLFNPSTLKRARRNVRQLTDSSFGDQGEESERLSSIVTKFDSMGYGERKGLRELVVMQREREREWVYLFVRGSSCGPSSLRWDTSFIDFSLISSISFQRATFETNLCERYTQMAIQH
jgi:hypothetical protein